VLNHLSENHDDVESDAENSDTNNVDGNRNRSIQGTDVCGVVGNYNDFVKVNKNTYINCEFNDGKNNSAPSQLSSPLPTVKAKKALAEFILAGSFDDINENKLKAIQNLLRKIAPDTELIIQRAEKSSIRITVEANIETLELLKSLVESGELTQLFEFPIENVQILNKDLSDDNGTPVSFEKLSPQEIVKEIIESGRRNLIEANLIGADLVEANLIGANLTCANLIGADLSGAELIEANLTCAKLIGAKLTGAKLIGACLTGGRLNRADLSRADLSRAELSRVNLIRANLIEANLIDVNLIGADLINANLTGANLTGANLTGANLTGARLSRANLSRSDLTGAIVTKAIFIDTIGLLETERADLERKGAIFRDRPTVIA
jgi:uncharacterized protein YjbI with pentapeptide repeats